MSETIREGFDVFVHDGIRRSRVRRVSPGGKPGDRVYVETRATSRLPLSAVQDVHDEKVILDAARSA